MTTVRAYENSGVVSVTARGEHNFTNAFEGLNIDWAVGSSQLIEWSILFQDGRKLRADLTFCYHSAEKPAIGINILRRKGRGWSTITHRCFKRRARVFRPKRRLWVEPRYGPKYTRCCDVLLLVQKGRTVFLTMIRTRHTTNCTPTTFDTW